MITVFDRPGQEFDSPPESDKSYYDSSYAVEPPFEQWETEGDPVSTSGWNK